MGIMSLSQNNSTAHYESKSELLKVHHAFITHTHTIFYFFHTFLFNKIYF